MATSSASPAGGTYGAAQTVTLTSVPPADIHFTLDGSTPTIDCPKYLAPIHITSNETLKFVAIDAEGNTETPIHTETYVIDTTPPISDASPAGDTYGAAQTVTLSSESGATIHYTTDGSTPTTSSSTYSSPINISADTTLKFFAVDAVGNQESPHTETYVIDTTPPTSDASPAGNTYGAAQTVTLSSESGATIHYTTDGSTPTTSSSTYSSPINISADTTLKFFAVDAVGNQESPHTETYVIDTTPPTSTASPTGGTSSTAQNVTLSSEDGANDSLHHGWINTHDLFLHLFRHDSYPCRHNVEVFRGR